MGKLSESSKENFLTLKIYKNVAFADRILKFYTNPELDMNKFLFIYLYTYLKPLLYVITNCCRQTICDKNYGITKMFVTKFIVNQIYWP